MTNLFKKFTSQQFLVPSLILLLFLILTTVNLDVVPPVWLDEGWTLNVARNWVEQDHYGQLINDQPRGVGLSAAFPIVAPIALSFRLFGVGAWQGRLPNVLYLLSSLVLIYQLANILYNRKIAVGTLVVLLLLSGPKFLHPLTAGRMAMGEMPMIFFLLAGYTLFYLALRKSNWIIFPAALLWGVAIKTKAQPLPFWLISLLIPLIVCITKHWWKEAILVSVGIGIALMASFGIDIIKTSIIVSSFRSEPLPGLIQAVALVFNPITRVLVLGKTLTIGLLTVVGILYAARNTFKKFIKMTNPDIVELTHLVLLIFLASWLAWYTFLSFGHERYIFPVIFIGSIFTTSLINQLTCGFKVKSTINKAAMVFFRRRDRITIGAFLVLILITFNGSLTFDYLYLMYANPGIPISEITGYIESISNPDDLIETYESELFFLLDRPYHYPPDTVTVQWITSYNNPNEKFINYDPLEANPEILVIGLLGKNIYNLDRLLSNREFRLVKTFPDYLIYAKKIDRN